MARKATSKKTRVKVKKKVKIPRRTSGGRRRAPLGIGARMMLWAFLVLLVFTVGLWVVFAFTSAKKEPEAKPRSEKAAWLFPDSGRWNEPWEADRN